MSWLLGGKPLSRILVTRLRYLGDVIMSSVVLDVLRRGDPGLELGYLLETPFGPALAGRSGLKRLHRLGAQRRGADSQARSYEAPAMEAGSGTPGMVRDLRRCRYDLAIDLFFNPRSSLLLFLAGIPERIGGAASWRRHLYTRTVVPADAWLHDGHLQELAGGALGHHLCRLQPLVHRESGLPFFQWLLQTYRPGDLKPRLEIHACELPAEGGKTPDPGTRFLVLAPGATWPSKSWPLARWLDLVRSLLAGYPDDVWVLTPPGRQIELEGLARLIPGGRGGVLPPLPLGEVFGILSRARAVMAVDGGIMHAAVGLGVPTVGIFGPTDPQIWFPYESAGPFRVVCLKPPCHPCDRHHCEDFVCLPDLPADWVEKALESVLST